MMGTLPMTEEHFGDESIWLTDDVGEDCPPAGRQGWTVSEPIRHRFEEDGAGSPVSDWCGR